MKRRNFIMALGGAAAVVAAVNGALAVRVRHADGRAAALLSSILQLKAESVAARIEQFVKEIESQIGWTTQLPWSADRMELRRFDAVRLLRQVPAISEFALLDPSGHEQLRVSRLAMEVVGSNLDLSADPRFTEAVAHKVYYGPVYLRRESEAYMTLSLAGTRR